MAADYCSLAKIYPLCLHHIFQKQWKTLVSGSSQLAFGNATNSDLKLAEKSASPALAFSCMIDRHYLGGTQVLPYFLNNQIHTLLSLKTYFIMVFYLLKEKSQSIIPCWLKLKAFNLKKSKKLPYFDFLLKNKLEINFFMAALN